MSKPKIMGLGVDFAGQVEAVGRKVTHFEPGDQVFGTCHGAFAEYVCTSESELAIKPANVTFEQVASAPIDAFTARAGLDNEFLVVACGCPAQKSKTRISQGDPVETAYAAACQEFLQAESGAS